MLSMHAEPNYVRTCLEAGARGYLLKNALDLELVSAVRQGRRRRAGAGSALGTLAEARNRSAAQTDHARTRSAAVDRAREVEQRDCHVLGLSANTVPCIAPISCRRWGFTTPRNWWCTPFAPGW
jgi:DNA-binding NarL/FixJ family response regulator